MLDMLDIFAGAGGFSLGLRTAGIRPRCAVELDPDAAQTYAGHSPASEILVGDIRAADLARYQGIDLLCGGPPCQPFSSGGARGAQRDQRDMLPEFSRVLAQLRPAAFVLENVPGLTVGARGAYFQATLAQFAALGYRLAWQILNAADFGVPQSRRRLFVVGMRQRSFEFPAATHGPGRARPHVAVCDALPAHQLGEPNQSTVTFAKKPDLRPSPYHGLLFNGGGRPINPALPAPTILASAGGNKTHFFDQLELVPAYHRHLLAGGAPRSGVLPGARRLTIRESALLQSFPPDSVFYGPKSAQYQQIGNAVPPLLAYALGVALAAQLR